MKPQRPAVVEADLSHVRNRLVVTSAAASQALQEGQVVIVLDPEHEVHGRARVIQVSASLDPAEAEARQWYTLELITGIEPL